jgi:hypothetical protein
MKDAVTRSQRQLADAGLEITKVELELLTTLSRTAGGALMLKVVEVGAHRTRADTQTLALDLTPTAVLDIMGPSLADELQEAIVAAAAASAEAANTQPRFTLDEARIALGVQIAKQGKVSVFVEGSADQEAAHTLTVRLRPKRS